MSNYDKHLNHWKNHRKDRHTQQCGFCVSEPSESYASVAERTAEGYYVGYVEDGTRLSPVFTHTDDAVDFYYSLPLEEQLKCATYTDKGMIVMR